MVKVMKWMSIMFLSVWLVACQSEEQDVAKKKVSTAQEFEQHENEEAYHHDHQDDGHNHENEEVHHHDPETDRHKHKEDEASNQIYAGYFEDNQVQNRELSDWAGDWQSVYPYLLEGTLDEVFEHKAQKSNTMTAVEYKQYYETGYITSMNALLSSITMSLFMKVSMYTQRNMKAMAMRY